MSSCRTRPCAFQFVWTASVHAPMASINSRVSTPVHGSRPEGFNRTRRPAAHGARDGSKAVGDSVDESGCQSKGMAGIWLFGRLESASFFRRRRWLHAQAQRPCMEDRGTSDCCECRAHPVSGVRTEQVAAACGSRSIRRRRLTHTGLTARHPPLPACHRVACGFA